MNKYCSKLNFPVKITADLSEYKVGQRNQVRVFKDVMGADLNNLLLNCNVEIEWVEVFYLGAGADHTIHCDGHELNEKSKINYIIGGKNSVMSWYTPINETKIKKEISKANTLYLGLNIEDSCEVYHTTMDEGFYLVNVGQFHNVWNKEEDRYCFSICLMDKNKRYRISFSELQNRLRDYINE